MTGLEAKQRMSLVNAQGQDRREEAREQAGRPPVPQGQAGGRLPRSRGGGEQSDPLTVLTTRSAPPSEDVYDQEIPESGYGYLTTRDGTKLAYYVHPPEDVSNALPTGYVPHVPAGPKPTLIEYSGYGYADPAGPQSGISIIANLMGFSVVDINMRGTGCSGGAFDFFEPLQSLDGYDIIETVARQPWVKHGKVGMMGISYGGISQLFTAQTNPPSLAAISPLSLIDAVQTTLYPGGILNTGFAFNWAKERAHEAKPAGPETGQEWAYQRIQEGDQVCADNQVMHGEAAALIDKVRANDTYRPKVADPLSPVTFVDKIKVPTFVACQWTDEQTGGHCPTLASRFTGTDKKWFTFTNGTHVDSLAPETFNRWYDFLKLYVAKEAPAMNQAAIRAGAPLIYQAAMGIDGVMLPPGPDPGGADVRGRARRVRGARPDPHPVRQRRGHRAGPPAARLRALVPALPDPRHDRALVVLRERRRADRRAALRGGDGLVQVERAQGPDDQLHRQHGGGRRRPVDRDAAVRMGAALDRRRRVLPDRAARRGHRGRSAPAPCRRG